jgi:hypothetical protein
MRYIGILVLALCIAFAGVGSSIAGVGRGAAVSGHATEDGKVPH